MPTLKNIATGGGLITGAAGLTALFGYSTGLFNPNIQIAKLLEWENKYTLLSKDEEWQANWKQYQEDNKSAEINKDKWEVKGWKKEEVSKVPEDFKSKCSSKKDIEVRSKEVEEYIDFTKYCARPKTVQEILSQNGFKPLQGDKEDDEWKIRIDKYKNSDNQLPNAKIAKDDSSKNFNILKEECKEALKLKTTDTNYNETLSPTKEWCGN